jgi:hypothetical protein
VPAQSNPQITQITQIFKLKAQGSKLKAQSSKLIARGLGGWEAIKPEGEEDSNLIHIYIFYRIRFFLGFDIKNMSAVHVKA